MRVLRSASEAGKAFPGAVITVGKFDAMHLGHRKIVGQAVKRAKALKTSCVVVTFDPAPDQFMRLFPYQPVLTLGEKLQAMGELGVDAALLLPFDKKLACLSPEAFVRNVFSMRLKPVSVFVGADFCFGRDRAGSPSTLEDLGREAGFTVHVVPVVKAKGEKITAAAIRRLVTEGRLRDAETLLGRPISRSRRTT